MQAVLDAAIGCIVVAEASVFARRERVRMHVRNDLKKFRSVERVEHAPAGL
jgi:hypothetical protein